MKNIFIFLLCTGLSSCAFLSKKSKLEEVLDRKEIVIGTTGDYPPFSYKDKKTGEFKGSDIELGKSIAKSLGVKAHFYQTSWKGLLEDLKNKKYDIAISGISITDERKKMAFFSRGYLNNGKAPIVRCKDVKKYRSLKAIDKESVRLIVNPGGTNDKYAKNNIKMASVRFFDDNTKIFHEILNDRADVMITDLPEVLFQIKKHRKKLCAPMGNKTLTKSSFGVLMPKDNDLKKYIDNYLNQNK